VNPARHPYRLAPARRLADADLPRHVADLVRLVLLTSPGERLHRPELGAGLGSGVLFQPLQSALLGVVELRARGALTQTLGDRIRIDRLVVTQPGESTIEATLHYRLRTTGEEQTVTLRAGGGS
jgi:uncharacterized protein